MLLVGNYFGNLPTDQTSSPRVRGRHASASDPWVVTVIEHMQRAEEIDTAFSLVTPQGMFVGRLIVAGVEDAGRPLVGVAFGALSWEASPSYEIPPEALELAWRLGSRFDGWINPSDIDRAREVQPYRSAVPARLDDAFWEAVLRQWTESGAVHCDVPADPALLGQNLVCFLAQIGPLLMAGRPILVLHRTHARRSKPQMHWPHARWTEPALLLLYPAEVAAVRVCEPSRTQEVSKPVGLLLEHIARWRTSARSHRKEIEFVRALRGSPFQSLPGRAHVAERIAENLCRALADEVPPRLQVATFVEQELSLPGAAEADRAERVARFFDRPFQPNGRRRLYSEDPEKPERRLVLDLSAIRAWHLAQLYEWSELGSIRIIFDYLGDQALVPPVKFSHLMYFMSPTAMAELVQQRPELLKRAFEESPADLAWYLGEAGTKAVSLLTALAAAAPSDSALFETVPTFLHRWISQSAWIGLRREDENAYASRLAALPVADRGCILTAPNALDGASGELIARLAAGVDSTDPLCREQRHAIIDAAIQLDRPDSSVVERIAPLIADGPTAPQYLRWLTMGERWTHLNTEQRIRLFFPGFARAVVSIDTEEQERLGRCLPDAKEVARLPDIEVESAPTVNSLRLVDTARILWALLAWSLGDPDPDDWRLVEGAFFQEELGPALQPPHSPLIRAILGRPRSRVFAPELVLAGATSSPLCLEPAEFARSRAYLIRCVSQRGGRAPVVPTFLRSLSLRRACTADEVESEWDLWLTELLPDTMAPDPFQDHAWILLQEAREVMGRGPILAARLCRHVLNRCLRLSEPEAAHIWLLEADCLAGEWIRRWWTRARVALAPTELLSVASALRATVPLASVPPEFAEVSLSELQRLDVVLDTIAAIFKARQPVCGGGHAA